MARTKNTTKAKKASSTAKPAKKAATATKKKTGARRKRYTPAERKKIIAFVESVNAEKGRGGVTAAAKKFSVSPLSISNWIKKQVAGGAVKAAPKRGRGVRKKAVGAGADVLDQLVALRGEISAIESQLAAKRAQFDKLKSKL